MLKLTEEEKRLVAYGDATLLKKKLDSAISLVLPRITKGTKLEDIRYWQGTYAILEELYTILETSR